MSLLREKKLNPAYAEALMKLGVGGKGVRALGEKMLYAGPEALSTQEKMLVLSDADAMSWLHRLVWLRPSEAFAPWWRDGIRRYGH